MDFLSYVFGFLFCCIFDESETSLIYFLLDPCWNKLVSVLNTLKGVYINFNKN